MVVEAETGGRENSKGAEAAKILRLLIQVLLKVIFDTQLTTFFVVGVSLISCFL